MKIRKTKYLFCLWIVLIIQLFFISCERGQSTFVEFPDRENLYVSKEWNTGDVFMRYPFRIRVNDSALYVMDLHAPEYYCHEFYYPSMKHKRSFAKRGQGPGEFMDAENIRLAPSYGCWILDADNARISCFHDEVPDSLEKELQLDKHLIKTLDFDLYNDSMFIVPDYTGTHRFNILNPNGTIKERRGRIPLQKKDTHISDAAYAQAWRGFVSYDASTGLLAIATQLGHVLELYDVPGDSLIRVIYGREGEPRFDYVRGYAVPTGIMGYNDIFIGKEYIYTIFTNRSFDEIKKSVDDSPGGGNNIHVFDHSGNPVKHYVLDRFITGFFVDEKKNVIFGLDVNSDLSIVEFALR